MTGSYTYDDAADEELVARSANGDSRAFDTIVARHGPFALRVAGRILPDRVMAEDVVQEALVRAWSQAARFDPARARFRTWLYRIIINLCIDQGRRVQPEQIPEGFEAAGTDPSAEDLVASHERDAALLAALATLPPRQRAVMTLVYDEGMSGAEAARILGLSAKAVERLLARSRSHLRECLQTIQN